MFRRKIIFVKIRVIFLLCYWRRPCLFSIAKRIVKLTQNITSSWICTEGKYQTEKSPICVTMINKLYHLWTYLQLCVRYFWELIQYILSCCSQRLIVKLYTFTNTCMNYDLTVIFSAGFIFSHNLVRFIQSA